MMLKELKEEYKANKDTIDKQLWWNLAGIVALAVIILWL